MTTPAAAKITTVAKFAEHFMPEMAVRADGSILVTASPQRQLWYVPAPSDDGLVEPTLLYTFEEGHLGQSMVEAQPDIFYAFTYGKASMYRFDLRDWTPGSPVNSTKIMDFEPPAGPNGSALLAPGVMLVADCAEGSIWQVDLSGDGLHAAATVWLKHRSMEAGAGHPPIKFSADQEVPFPGINGLRYGPKTNFVYYASSSQNVFMRVAVDPATLEPSGEPEHLADIDAVDDLCLDEDTGVAYIARHPDHKIERTPLTPNSGHGQTVVAGQPFTDALIGPTSITWGRGPNDYGRVAYATTDGVVIKLAPSGVLRPARLVRLELPAEDSTPS